MFKYEKKETYTQQDMDGILNQHKNFVEKGFKNYVPDTEHNKVKEELNNFRLESRNNKIKNLSKDTINAEMLDDVLKLVDIKDEDTDDEIKNKLTTFVKNRPFYGTNYVQSKNDALQDITVKGNKPAPIEEKPEVVDKYSRGV